MELVLDVRRALEKSETRSEMVHPTALQTKTREVSGREKKDDRVALGIYFDNINHGEEGRMKLRISRNAC